MQLLTGMYYSKIDDKGRLSLPARLRNVLSAEQVVVLPGLDGNHMMLMTPEFFDNEFCKPILSTPMAMMDSKKRALIRKLISPAQNVDIDSSGRINVPLQMREQYGLVNKSDALFVGTGYAIEIWNPDKYEAFMAESEESLSDLAQSLYDEEK